MSDPEKATLPKFHDILEAYPKELRSSIQFPLFNLRTLGLRGTVVKAVLSKKEKKKVEKTLVLFCVFLRPDTDESSPDPPTQTDLPEDTGEENPTVLDRKRRHLEPAAPLPVAVVIVFKSLGKLLPERYDPDRRSLR